MFAGSSQAKSGLFSDGLVMFVYDCLRVLVVLYLVVSECYTLYTLDRLGMSIASQQTTMSGRIRVTKNMYGWDLSNLFSPFGALYSDFGRDVPVESI